MSIFLPTAFSPSSGDLSQSIRFKSSGSDPASSMPGMPPNLGEEPVPHTLTFVGLVGSFAKAYLQSDEAMRDSWKNARLMRNDVGLMECVESRQRMVAMLDWSIEPENDQHAGHKLLAKELQSIIGRIRRFVEYRRNLQEAIWYGKTAIQNRYRWQQVGDATRLLPSSDSPDHYGWRPVHGDKLVFRYDDGTLDPSRGEYPDQMGVRSNTYYRRESVTGQRAPESSAEGFVQFLMPHERQLFTVHRHMIEDADYWDPYFAGSIHGVGIRSRVYWEWTLMKETLAFLMQYLERSAGGIELWFYPQGDDKALEAAKTAAKERQANGRNTLFVPRPAGEDASSFGVEVVEPGFAGMDILQTLIQEYFSHRIKRYILGQTLSSEAASTGLGSGVADAHMDTLFQIVSFDASNQEDTLTEELVRQIQLYNFPETAGWHMRFKLHLEDDNTESLLASYRTAWDMGAAIPERQVLDACGIRQVQPDERTLSNSPPVNFGYSGIDPDGMLDPQQYDRSAAVLKDIARYNSLHEISQRPGTSTAAFDELHRLKSAIKNRLAIARTRV